MKTKINLFIQQIVKSIIFIGIASITNQFLFAQGGGWAQKENFGGSGRYGATGFSVGAKGYIATGIDASSLKNDVWEYDPSLNTWEQKANFPGEARRHAVVFTIGTKAYVGLGSSGAPPGGPFKNDFWEYDPSLDTWIQITDFPGTARAGAVAFSIGTKGFVGTGSDGTFLKDFYEWDQISDTWTQKTDFPGTARVRAVGFSIDSSGYIGTGFNGTNHFQDFWRYSPSSDTWTQIANFGGSSRRSAVAFSIGTKAYVGTGYDGSDKKDFWEYDPTLDTWTQKTNFGGLIRHCATGFSIGSKGYIGTGIGATYYKDFWEYDTTTTSINGLSLNEIEIIFYSSNSSVFIYSSENIKEVIILEITGKKIISISNLNINETQVNIESLPHGIYLATIITEKQGSITRKFIK